LLIDFFVGVYLCLSVPIPGRVLFRGGSGIGDFGGFLRVCVPETEQNLKKPEKTCGNRRNAIDKARGKAEGELRYGSPHPHEH
jgi:hypothetical protein